MLIMCAKNVWTHGQTKQTKKGEGMTSVFAFSRHFLLHSHVLI